MERDGLKTHSDSREKHTQLRSLTADEAYRLVSARRRRLLLRLLDSHGELALREAARLIAAVETETTPAAVLADALDMMYVSLYQTHVPTLEAAGVVEWDEATGTVCSGHSVPGLVTIQDNVAARVEGHDTIPDDFQ